MLDTARAQLEAEEQIKLFELKRSGQVLSMHLDHFIALPHCSMRCCCCCRDEEYAAKEKQNAFNLETVKLASPS